MNAKPRVLRSIGHRGYLKQRKLGLFIRALILATGVFLLVLTGYLVVHTVRNWFTIVGLVTAIPLAMQLATLFSILPYKEPDQTLYDEVRDAVGNGVFDTELLVANKDGKSYYFPYVYFHTTGIFAYLPENKQDPVKASEYIRNYLRLHEADQELIVYQDYDLFLRGLKSLEANDRNTVPEVVLRQEGVFRAISM